MKNREQLEGELNEVAFGDSEHVKSEAERIVDRGVKLSMLNNEILLDIRDLLEKLTKKK